MSKHTRLSPTSDLVFKLLFSKSEDVLISLLTAVLKPARPITSAVVLNPLLSLASVTEKSVVLDIRVRFDDGTLVGVEMQTNKRQGATSRWIYYWAKNFSSQLKTGEDYRLLKPCIGVYFFDYKEEDGRFHSIYDLSERASGRVLSNLLQLHTIELPRLPQSELVKIASADKLECWSRYLTSNDPAEISALQKADPMIQKVEAHLEDLSASEDIRTALEQRELEGELERITRGEYFRSGLAEGLAEGEAKGLAEGLAEGEAKGLAEGEAKGLADNIRKLCASFEIELTPTREEYLSHCDLGALFDELLKTRAWSKE